MKMFDLHLFSGPITEELWDQVWDQISSDTYLKFYFPDIRCIATS